MALRKVAEKLYYWNYTQGQKDTLKQVKKIINEMKLHNSSDENRNYNRVLKEVNLKLTQTMQKENMK